MEPIPTTLICQGENCGKEFVVTSKRAKAPYCPVCAPAARWDCAEGAEGVMNHVSLFTGSGIPCLAAKAARIHPIH